MRNNLPRFGGGKLDQSLKSALSTGDNAKSGYQSRTSSTGGNEFRFASPQDKDGVSSGLGDWI